MEETPEKPTDVLNNKFITKHTIYFIWGIVSICFSVFLIIKGSNRISHGHYNNYAEWNDLVQANLALPAFLASLGGIFFVVDNLKLQRNTLLVQIEANKMQYEELKLQILESKESNEHFKKQNETLLNQQADNSFFNLLEHHKLFLNNMNISNEYIVSLYNKLKADSIEYKKNIELQKFNSIIKTQYNPTYKYSLNKNNDFKFLSGYFNNIKLIVEFINLNFSTDATKLNFYHSIFFNSINAINQNLLGAVIDYKIFNIPTSASFDYLDSYKERHNWYKQQQPSFPVLKLNGSDGFDSINIPAESLLLYSEKIEIVKFFNNETQLKLKKYIIKIIEITGDVSYNTTFETNKLYFLGDEIEICLGEIFNNIIGDETMSVSEKFSISFFFDYGEFEFEVYQNYTFERRYLSIDNYTHTLKRVNNLNN